VTPAGPESSDGPESGSAGPLDVLHVVVPAHDEEELLGGCLTSIEYAVAELAHVPDAPRVAVTVVLDACLDGTASILAEHEAHGAHGAHGAQGAHGPYRVEGVAVEFACVGRAREAGVARVAEIATGTAPERVWVAMTDADSQVPPDWLGAQLEMARRGIELFVGRAHPDGRDLTSGVLARWWELHRFPGRLPIHGANLGFTLAAHRRAGGFPPVREHEDVSFVRSAVAAGCAWTQDGPWVRTSGRATGRTPGGFAGYVRTLAAAQPEPEALG
jgi:hypothetical protein